MKINTKNKFLILIIFLTAIPLISWIIDLIFCGIQFNRHKVSNIKFWVCEIAIIIQIGLNIYIFVILYKSLIENVIISKCNIPFYLNALIADTTFYLVFYPRIYTIYIITLQICSAIINIGFIQKHIRKNDENSSEISVNYQISYFYNPELPDTIENINDDESELSESYEKVKEEEDMLLEKKLFEKNENNLSNDEEKSGSIKIQQYICPINIDECSFQESINSSNPYSFYKLNVF